MTRPSSIMNIALAAGALAAFALPALARAQTAYPGGNVPPPPVNMDPGSPVVTTAPVPDRPAAPQPSVVVVGADGKIAPAKADQPSGYYVGGNDGAAPADEPDSLRTGAVPELHVVRGGDTLWDICFLYFNDPFQWPKIWSYNPQITNPHWIYPGDLVRLLPRGVFAEASPTPATAAGTPDTSGSDRGAIDMLPAPQRKLEVGIKETAFVEKSDLDKSSTIDGAVDEKVLLGDGDQVYLSYPEGKPPKVGDRYAVYKPDNLLKSGDTEIGAYVRVYGTVEIVSVKQDKVARGVIVEANQEVERGLKVGPLLRRFKTVPPSQPKVDAQGSIVAILTNDQLIGQGEVVFVDLGKKSGIEVGNRMYVVRRGDALPQKMSLQIGQDDRKFPARALGEIVIVDVGDAVSVGLVTLTVKEFSRGDLVTMQATK